MLRIQKPELLAPACSYEGFLAVMEAGADAAYISGQAFGARAYAKNCTQDELLRCIDLAHIYGKKLYLTVNTLLKDQELRNQLVPELEPLYLQGLDAVLVQDFGVLSVLRRAFPELPLHASTQMAVTGPAALGFLAEQGITRVVPARELSLAEITAMCREEKAEIEVFVHGSLCYSFSGLCLFSSFLGGRSGNRGRCAQPCRLNYQAGGRKSAQACLLSMKDLNTITLLPDLVRAGVASLKIEGRMKAPSYAASVTRIYRKYLDQAIRSVEEGISYRVEEHDLEELRTVYSRGGSCTGYYKRHNGPEMICLTNEKKISGQSVEEDNHKRTLPRLSVRGKLVLKTGKPVSLQVQADNSEQKIHIEVTGDQIQPATGAPLQEDQVRGQMNRLGDTPFCWENLEIQMDGDCFLPVSALNRLRRQGMDRLEQELCAVFKRREKSPEADTFVSADPVSRTDHQRKDDREFETADPFHSKRSGCSCKNLPSVRVLCENREQAVTALEHPVVQAVYLPPALAEDLERELKASGKEWYLALPHILREPDLEAARIIIREGKKRGASGFLVRNLEEYAVLEQEDLTKDCILDHMMYTWNSEAIGFWLSRGVKGLTAPLELNQRELAHRNNSLSEQVVYGYLPLMTTAQCVVKNTRGCEKKNGESRMVDRFHKAFTSSCFCTPWKSDSTEKNGLCYSIIYNSLPLSLLSETGKLSSIGLSVLRVELTGESPAEAAFILDCLQNSLRSDHKQAEEPVRDYTRGHYNRGAE